MSFISDQMFADLCNFPPQQQPSLRRGLHRVLPGALQEVRGLRQLHAAVPGALLGGPGLAAHLQHPSLPTGTSICIRTGNEM